MPESQFVYLLNALEEAGKHEYPAAHDYAGKRKALLDYVNRLEDELNALHRGIRNLRVPESTSAK